MALETGTYISDLVVTNPTASDPKSQGDDHLRLVKATVKTTFANITGAVTPTHTELNKLAGATMTTAELNKLTGLTSTTTELNKLTGATVTTAEINRLVGVTSAIQTQIDAKGAITGQTWTGTHAFPSTVSFGLVSATEISYLDGVTGAIQTQIDGKGAITGQAWTGTHTFPTQTLGSNNTRVATTAYVDQTAFSSALPAKLVGFLSSPDGVTVSFTQFHVGYAQKEAKGANIASAATINLSTATGNFVHVTGTTGITAITIDSGAEYTVVFDGVLTVTHNAASLILPSGQNETTAAGDVWIIRGDGTNVARVTNIQGIGKTQTSVSGSQLDKTSDTTLANIPNLSATLVAGGTYKVRLVAHTTSVTVGGVKFALNGGTATATSFVATMSYVQGGGTSVTDRVTTLSGTMGGASATGNLTTIEATIVCSASGTLIPQFAQTTSNATPSSVLALSTLTVDRIS